MKRNRIKEFFGMKYVYNKTSKQIHKIDNLTPICFFESIVDGHYCYKNKALRLIISGPYDGCYYCWEEMNKKYSKKR